MDRDIDCALRAGRRVLAAGRLDSDQNARFGAIRGEERHAITGRIPHAFPVLVSARVAGLFGRDRDFHTHDIEAAAVILRINRNPDNDRSHGTTTPI